MGLKLVPWRITTSLQVFSHNQTQLDSAMSSPPVWIECLSRPSVGTRLENHALRRLLFLAISVPLNLAVAAQPVSQLPQPMW